MARDTRLREDLGIDSLSLIEVAVAAEDAFGVPIPDEDLERFQTVGDVIDYSSAPRSPPDRRPFPPAGLRCPLTPIQGIAHRDD